jgi:hypothetical protein
MIPRRRRPDGFEGLLAEFATPEALLHAIEEVREAGFSRFDAYSPYPLHELAHAMGASHSKLPWIVLGGGITGALSGWALQYWTSTTAYPMNIGGRPYNSWPAFIIVIFEMTILFAAFSAVLGMFALSGLPKPHHPLFNVERFTAASKDRYFLFISVDDPKFEAGQVQQFLEGLTPSEVTRVED